MAYSGLELLGLARAVQEDSHPQPCIVHKKIRTVRRRFYLRGDADTDCCGSYLPSRIWCICQMGVLYLILLGLGFLVWRSGILHALDESVWSLMVISFNAIIIVPGLLELSFMFFGRIWRHFSTFEGLDGRLNGAFRHQRLDEEYAIRLLDILPGNKKEPLRCKTRSATLPPSLDSCCDTLPGYYALSYSWNGIPAGRSTRLKACLRDIIQWFLRNRMRIDIRSFGIARESRVEIDGQSFFITYALARALMNLRSEFSTRTIWCDQICINQSDKIEKTVQVTLMPVIYRHASKVIVWLDIARNNITTAYSNSDQVNQDPLDLGSFDSMRNTQNWSILIELMDGLVHCRWWSRVWVVQEVALGSDIEVRFEGGKCTWDELTQLLRSDTICSRLEIPSSVTRLIARVQKYRQGVNDAAQGVLSLMYEFRESKATVELDKIYAIQSLLGTFDRSAKPECEINYESDAAVVLGHVTVQLVNKYRSLACLASVESRDRASRLSWSPLWANDRPQLREPLHLGDLARVASERTSLNGESTPRGTLLILGGQADSPRTFPYLALEGREVGKIVSRGAQYICQDSMKVKREVFRKWQLLVKQSHGTDDSGEKGLQTLGLMLGEPAEVVPENWIELLERDDASRAVLNKRCSGRRLLILEDGSVALGHSGSKKGDMVVDFTGAGIPYIIRPTRHRGARLAHSFPRTCFRTCHAMIHSKCCLPQTYVLIGQVAVEESTIPIHERTGIGSNGLRDFILE